MTMWTPDLGPSDEPLYAAIARAVADDVRRGRLAAGDRLPTHRDLADALGVTVGTVSRAYAEAARRGLVRGEVGRGTFVAGNGAGEMPLRLEGPARPGVVDLGLNMPVYAEDPDLAGALRNLSQRSDLQELLRYRPSEGTLRHRSAGARWLRRCGVETDPGRVTVCAGSQHAVAVSLAAVARPGDRILVEELTYPGIKALAGLWHLTVEPVAVDAGGLVPEALEAACRRGPAALLYTVPTLHNPTVTTLTEARREAVARIARAHGLWIVEDDVHRPLVGPEPAPLAARAPERTLFIGGTSKALAGGLRIAYLTGPAELTERLSVAVTTTVWMASPITAELAAIWIEDGTADRVLGRKRKAAAERHALARGVLAPYPFRGDPHAFHLWLELPEPWRCEAFAAEARARGVVVTSAEAFVVGRVPVPHCVRLCLGAPDRLTDLEGALGQIRTLLDRGPSYGSPVV